jgi:hypothetical protein
MKSVGYTYRSLSSGESARIIGTTCQNATPKVPKIAFNRYLVGRNSVPRNRRESSYLKLEH